MNLCVWVSVCEWVYAMRVMYVMCVQGEKLRVFTTSQHTLYGVTFIAISPDHPLVKVKEIP